MKSQEFKQAQKVSGTILTENYPLTIKKTWLTKTEKEG
jgi:hypothetical protein